MHQNKFPHNNTNITNNNTNNNNTDNTNNNPFVPLYLRECEDPVCVYTRKLSSIREKYEEKIIAHTQDKNDISILFYASCYLYQEYRILESIINKVSEIHITDHSYKLFLENPNDYFFLVIDEFANYIITHNPNIDIYIHSDPTKLKSIRWHRRFDIICGIDIDYDDNLCGRDLIKDISSSTLKINGYMITSQNCLDQVDLCTYIIGSDSCIQLIEAIDYVKAPYFAEYKIKNIFDNIIGYTKISVCGIVAGMIGIFNIIPLPLIAACGYVSYNSKPVHIVQKFDNVCV